VCGRPDRYCTERNICEECKTIHVINEFDRIFPELKNKRQDDPQCPGDFRPSKDGIMLFIHDVLKYCKPKQKGEEE